MRSPAAAVGAVLAIALIALPLAGAGQEPDSSVKSVGRAQTKPRVLTIGRWRIRATVKPSRIGPINFAARNLSRERGRNSWVSHDLVFRNTGDRRAIFADTRTSAFIGPGHHKRLLAADPGCGWSPAHRGRPIQAGVCLAYRQRLVAEPHSRTRQSISLFKGLRGMDRLRAGNYAFPQRVRFRLRSAAKAGAETHQGVVRVVYRVRAR